MFIAISIFPDILSYTVCIVMYPVGTQYETVSFNHVSLLFLML